MIPSENEEKAKRWQKTEKEAAKPVAARDQLSQFVAG